MIRLTLTREGVPNLDCFGPDGPHPDPRLRAESLQMTEEAVEFLDPFQNQLPPLRKLKHIYLNLDNQHFTYLYEGGQFYQMRPHPQGMELFQGFTSPDVVN